MRWWWLLLVAAPAYADPDILGGSNAPDGMWPDTAALIYSGQVRCSGTLIGTGAVLTAAHCTDPTLGPPPDQVLVGTTSLDTGGEMTPVNGHVEFPSWQTSEDLAVVYLTFAPSILPRQIASGWGSLGIENGAAVEFVGWGTTDKDGTVRTRTLQQVASTITDATCATHPQDCRVPGGELAAGGNGLDTCPGDSGGPMYLFVDGGYQLAGVTSRGFMANNFACGEGGIYERPDQVMDWLDSVAEVKHGPEPQLDFMLEGGRGAFLASIVNPRDPLSDVHHLSIATQPMHATAQVDDDGSIHVCIAKDAPAGSDSVVVKFTDANDSSRSIEQAFPITIDDTADAMGPCDLGFGDAGCCNSGGQASLPVALAALAILRRRR